MARVLVIEADGDMGMSLQQGAEIDVGAQYALRRTPMCAYPRGCGIVGTADPKLPLFCYPRGCGIVTCGRSKKWTKSDLRL